MYNIAIADDHPLFSRGLNQLLSDEKELNVIGIAKNGLELISIVDNNNNNNDLAIVDL